MIYSFMYVCIYYLFNLYIYILIIIILLKKNKVSHIQPELLKY